MLRPLIALVGIVLLVAPAVIADAPSMQHWSFRYVTTDLYVGDDGTSSCGGCAVRVADHVDGHVWLNIRDVIDGAQARLWYVAFPTESAAEPCREGVATATELDLDASCDILLVGVWAGDVGEVNVGWK